MKKLPEMDTQTLEDPVLNTTQDFHMAVERCGVDHIDYLEVTDELFNRLFHHIVKGPEQMYVTHGSPGIKVYRKGMKDECDKRDRMQSEHYADYMVKIKLNA